jgi:hypothetical protein
MILGMQALGTAFYALALGHLDSPPPSCSASP